MADVSCLSIEHLYEDALLCICEYLDRESLGSLAQVCKLLRDKLYSPIFWRYVIWDDTSAISEDVADSLRSRDIQTVKFDEESLDIMASLRSIARMDFIVSMYVDSDAFESWKEVDLTGLSFSSLQCFIFHIYEYSQDDPHFVKVKTKAKYQKLSSILDCFLATMKSLTELHLYQQDTLKVQHTLDIFNSVNQHLPNLRDLEYKKFSGKRLKCCTDVNLSFSSNGLPCVERLSGIQISVDKLAQLFPGVRHVDVDGFVTACPTSDATLENIPIIPSVESLTLTGKRQKVSSILTMLPCFPQLKALDLGSVSKLSFDAIEKIMDSCSQLAVLNVTNAIPVTEDGVRSILQVLAKLEVLVLPSPSIRSGLPRLSSEKMFDNIDCRPKLKSVVGLTAERLHANTPNLLYKSHKTLSSCIVRRCDRRTGQINKVYSHSWRRITKFSHDWFDAYGIKFFYPECTFSVRRNLSSKSLLPPAVFEPSTIC